MNKIVNMRKSIFIALILLCLSSAFAEAADMEYFLPTEYQLMTELYQNDAQGFIKGKEEFLKKCEYINSRVLSGREYPEQKILYDNARMFFENVNYEKYIWVLLPVTRNNDEAEAVKNTDWATEFQYILALFKHRQKENKSDLIFIAPTCFFDAVHFTINTFEIIKGKNKNKGVIHFRNLLRYDLTFDSNNHWNGFSYRKTKEQAEGYVMGDYYLFDERSSTIEFEKEDGLPDFIYRPKSWNKIPITASAFLWELKNPLKYGLQNAFDQNPATSFVENTENDLMSLDIWIGESVEKAALINGYAKNTDLYKANNRIKSVLAHFTLSDDELSYQFIPCKSSNLAVTSIYGGSKYSDTCLAEVNFFCGGEWIFGDIEEVNE